MAVSISGISWRVLFELIVIFKEQNSLDFNRDTWCHLVLIHPRTGVIVCF